MNTNPSLNRRVAAERFASLSRRRFLRGLGTCLALPAFESLRPLSVRANDLKSAAHLGASSSGTPVRMAFVYFPNGAIPDAWWPATGEGKAFELSRTLQPLDRVKDQIQVVSGLDCKGATPGPDGAGDHARASGSFLTGVRVKKTAGSDIHANISIDPSGRQSDRPFDALSILGTEL